MIVSDKPFYSILTLTFASEGDLRIWRDKVEMFSSEKAIAYLKQHGQRSLTIIETRENDTIKGIAIWEYESQESREACQVYWSKWFDFDGKFLSKSTFVRGEKRLGGSDTRLVSEVNGRVVKRLVVWVQGTRPTNRIPSMT